MNRDSSGAFYTDSNEFPLQYAYQQMPYQNLQQVNNPYQVPIRALNPYAGQPDLNYPYHGHYQNGQVNYNYTYDPNSAPFYPRNGAHLVAPETGSVYQEWSTNDVNISNYDSNVNNSGVLSGDYQNNGKSRRFSARRNNKESRSNSNNVENSQNINTVPVTSAGGNGSSSKENPIRFSHQKQDNKFKHTERRKREKDNGKAVKIKQASFSEDGKSGSQINILQEQLSNGSYECMVCCDRVKQHHAIWNCVKCYHVFHMGCIRKWARSEAARVDGEGWRCPACQTTTKSFPNAYFCYCGKMKNPELNPNEMAHSCGEVCGKKRDLSKNCDHPCNILCHPGPCPPCPAMTKKYCNCGKESKRAKCGQTAVFSCTNTCGNARNCGDHICEEICHSGECEKCMEEVEQECFCSKEKRKIICGSKEFKDSFELSKMSAFSCGKICNNLLACGNHYCTDICHLGDCDKCVLLPSVIKFCSCGQTKIEKISDENNQPIGRKSCLDSIPVCDKTCNKPLLCGDDEIHYCQSKCHEGKCSPCHDRETTFSCRCGKSEKVLSCVEYAIGKEKGDDFICDRRCNKKRKCGRHKCGQMCCIDKEHKCAQVCGRKLTCGAHRCEETCHRGQCHSCYNVSFEDLTCYCGAEIILPPIQCGTKPPECSNICTREHSCYHAVQHSCHSEEKCPPCVQLVKKTCNCGRVIRNSIPCYQENVSCGLPCNKSLSCGHKCLKICHTGDCMPPEDLCKQPCNIMRVECMHPCSNPCHQGESCPETPCKSIATLKCACGNLQKQVECFQSIKMQRDIRNEVSSNHQLGGSIDISVFYQRATAQNQFFLPCIDQCRIIERNRRMAEALKIDTVKLDDDYTKRIYSDFLLDMVQRDVKFIEFVEQELGNLVDSVKWLGKSKSFSFAPMKIDKRQAIHELADVYSCKSLSFDEEPKRSVSVTSSLISKIPEILLSSVAKKRMKTELVYDKPKDDNTASSTRLLKSMKLVSMITPKDEKSTVRSQIIPTASNSKQQKAKPYPDYYSNGATGSAKSSQSHYKPPSQFPKAIQVKSEAPKEKEIDYFDVTD